MKLEDGKYVLEIKPLTKNRVDINLLNGRAILILDTVHKKDKKDALRHFMAQIEANNHVLRSKPYGEYTYAFVIKSLIKHTPPKRKLGYG